MTATEILKAYARRIRDQRRAHAEVTEPALAPAFQRLIDELLPYLAATPELTVSAEFRNPGVGRPDIALIRTGAHARAFIELKAPSKSADPARWRGHDKRQFERFSDLANWATSNFAELRLFERAEEIDSATIVPESALKPDRDDAKADRIVENHDPSRFLRLLERLCVAAGHEPAARDAEHLAKLMAHSARLVRGIVQDRLAELHAAEITEHPLLDVRRTFRDVLYSHPEAGGYTASDFDTLFSAAFAQTLAFGLLLVREGTGRAVDADAWEHMPEEHPLMRTALRVLSLPEVIQDIGIGFDVMRDTVNSFAAEILVVPPRGRDPILYFYEDFLRTFDPQARERFGVYYTPVEVVRYMVGALDRALRVNLRTQGLADPNVRILDPATGTGTFLLGIAERVREQAAPGGDGMSALALADLANRMFGFELLVGPYAVAHYRLHHALRSGDGEALEEAPVLPRLGVYLTDTLAEPGAAAPAGPLGFVARGIADERSAANEIKERERILAIIGNPPYRRLETGENRTLVGDWMDNLWDDLKEPVRDAGHGNQLNTFPELSVAFWRWAIWKLFEAENAPQRGVIAYITNRKFLTGWPYAGLRQMMREKFDRIEIIDLRGDVRRGERAGVENDQGVFNIQVGTAITLAIADGSKAEGELADITYCDTWAEGRFVRRSKLEWLEEAAEVGAQDNAVPVVRALLDDMRPRPFMNGDLASLRECFNFASSGLESKRDIVVYASTRDELRRKVEAVVIATGEARNSLFNSTDLRPAASAVNIGWQPAHASLSGYRPLDRRWHYRHSAWNDRPRPELSAVWGHTNVCLFSLPSGTNEGPATWCYSEFPDRHAFRGSYGGYAFPLHDRRPDVDASNLNAELVAGLGAAYGEEVTSEEAFDAILALLSASSYTLRFAEDLEDVFPHVPFPAEHGTFREAARIGSEIRAVETFARPPADRGPAFVSIVTPPRGDLAEVEYADGEVTLCTDGSGRVTGLPLPVWEFAVSGYRVLPRWLGARVGLPVDLALATEFRDICGRIAELIDLFAEADIVLETTLQDTLTREALGFAAEQDADDGSE